MNGDTDIAKEEHHISNSVYLIVGGFLIVLTAMEITVSYVHALRPVMVPLLIAVAKAAAPGSDATRLGVAKASR